MSDISSVVIPGLTGLLFAVILWAPKHGAGGIAAALAIVTIIAAETYQLILRPKLMVPLPEGLALAVQLTIMGLVLLVSLMLFRHGIKRRS